MMPSYCRPARLLGLALMLVLTSKVVGAPTNVLFILADDLGWMDLRCQGNSKLDTPNLDRLAAQGMRFTDAYAAAPVCSPTRAAAMTGLAPARLRLTNHVPDQKRFTPKDAKLLPAEMLDYLPASHTTIAERLKAAGYATGFFGKWHLADKADWKNGAIGDTRYYPEKQGFDINVGGCAAGGPPSFFSPYEIHSIEDGPEGEYLPDRLAEETIKYLRANRSKPWFVSLWSYTVHWPMQAPQDLVEKYEARKGPGVKDARYAAMIEAYDRSLGRIFEALDNLGLADDTLVVFTSDNGPFLGVTEVQPLREGKGYLYEGGIRVPMLARWPGKIPAGSVSAEPVITTDLFPTFLAAAGLAPAPGTPLDGEDITPILTGSGRLRRDALFFHYPNYAFHGGNRLGSAVRVGPYKLIERFDDGSVELYHLASDLSESQNIASAEPEVAARLRARLAAWRSSVDAAMPKRRES